MKLKFSISWIKINKIHLEFLFDYFNKVWDERKTRLNSDTFNKLLWSN